MDTSSTNLKTSPELNAYLAYMGMFEEFANQDTYMWLLMPSNHVGCCRCFSPNVLFNYVVILEAW